MVRIGRVISASGTAAGRMALGFVGVAVIAGAIAGPPESDAPAGSDSGEGARPTNVVSLRIPEGEPAAHVTVVDESGRELAVVSRWRNGTAAIAARRDNGIDVGCYFNVDGTASCEFAAPSRRTTLHIKPDGTVAATRGSAGTPRPAPASDRERPDDHRAAPASHRTAGADP